ATGAELWRFPLPNIADTVAIYGTDKARVVVGTRNSQVHLLDTDGTELWRAQFSNAVKGVDTVRNGARVVVGSETGAVTLLNGGTTGVIWQVQLPDRVNDVAMTADGNWIAAGLQSGEIYVLAGADGTTQQVIDGDAAIETVALSPDGRAVLWGDRSGGARLVDRAATAGEYANQQRLRSGLQIGVPLLLFILAIGFVLWVRQTAAGGQFWSVRAAPSRRFGRQVWRARVSYFFLIPTLTLLLIFNYYPALSGLYHAFTVWKPGVETRWVGLAQFQQILRDAYFWVGIKNAALLIFTGYAKTFTVPLLVAELIFAIRNRAVQYGIRSLFVIPLVVPGVVGILLWTNIYDPNIGLLNKTLQALNLEPWTRVWLGDENTALWSIIAIGFPWVSAFALLIFYGGLISIPQELFDASKVDGASVWRRFWSLDLPLLLPQFKLLLILGFIGGVQEFQSIFITTGGGPGNVTYTPALELYYQAVRFNNFGLASAIGTVLFLVILLGTVFYMRYITSAIEYEA
ncbi:MAG: ABC transporter permease subunit, partial [Chloroflexota bacterium]|nr:ABC transporter permease subunit [Chloroflexota bacterium]